MTGPKVPTTLDGLLEPLSHCFDAESARRVAGFRVDPAVEARLGILAEKANEGTLSDAERAEYEASINAADFISILKLKVRRQRQLTMDAGARDAVRRRAGHRCEYCLLRQERGEATWWARWIGQFRAGMQRSGFMA